MTNKPNLSSMFFSFLLQNVFFRKHQLQLPIGKAPISLFRPPFHSFSVLVSLFISSYLSRFIFSCFIHWLWLALPGVWPYCKYRSIRSKRRKRKKTSQYLKLLFFTFVCSSVLSIIFSMLFTYSANIILVLLHASIDFFHLDDILPFTVGANRMWILFSLSLIFSSFNQLHHVLLFFFLIIRRSE